MEVTCGALRQASTMWSAIDLRSPRSGTIVPACSEPVRDGPEAHRVPSASSVGDAHAPVRPRAGDLLELDAPFARQLAHERRRPHAGLASGARLSPELARRLRGGRRSDDADQ